jgi:anti-sigma B factor antagonist
VSAGLDFAHDQTPGGLPRLTVVGEIDLGNVEEFRRGIAEVGDGPILVDMSGVAYIDSAGLAALFARASDGELQIVCPSGSVVASLIEITRLGDLAVIHEG